MKRTNILLWALSLVIAAVLWGYVAFYNSEGEKVIDVPVEFINESALNNRDLMLVGGRGATVRVQFTGRIQDLANISNTAEAVVNLRNVTSVGDTDMEFILQGTGDLTSRPTRDFVTVTIDRIERKYVDLFLDFTGVVAEDYIMDPKDAEFNPSRILVTGPLREISAVHRAVAQYEPFGPITRSIVDLPINFDLYTEDGQLIESEYITTDNESVWMTIPVNMVKTVPLSINFIEGGGLTEGNISWRVEPERVRISGDPDLLDGINHISLITVNLAALQSDMAGERCVITYPNGVRNLDHIDEAMASITIIDAVSRDIEIPNSNINIKGLQVPEGYMYRVVGGPVTVTIRGPEHDVNLVGPHNVRVVADFTDMEAAPGARLRTTGEGFVDGFDSVGAVSKGYDVTVEIVPLTDETP